MLAVTMVSIIPLKTSIQHNTGIGESNVFLNGIKHMFPSAMCELTEQKELIEMDGRYIAGHLAWPVQEDLVT